MIREVASLPDRSGRLFGAVLESPRAGDATELHAVDLSGWALGRAGAVERVELRHRDRVLLVMEAARPRPDVAAAFPDQEAMSTGFAGSLGTLQLPVDYEVELHAFLSGGEAIPFARLRGSRPRLPAVGADGIQPLMLTTLGRTGSTWVTWLLAHHPELYCYRPFEFDVRVGAYWMSVLQQLSAPSNSLRQVQADGPLEGVWWADRPALATSLLGDPPLERWLTGHGVQELASFACGRIQAFYARAGAPPQAQYFIEKHVPAHVAGGLVRDAFAGAREIVLVRDFRDVFASVLAFNRKRGYEAFGRAEASSDEEYIETLRISAQELLDHWQRRDDSALLVRYEDVIRRPLETIRAVLRFLDLDEHPVEEMLSTATGEFTTGMSQHITAPDPRASVGRWRRDLAPSLAEQCEAAFGPVHEAFGY